MMATYAARIVWIGRRPLDAAIQASLDALAALGPAPLYIAADATDRAALERAYRDIKQRYEHMHGLVHAAIVLDDHSLANMDEARFCAGLAAKMDVSVRMAQVFQQEALDFVLFFSSLQSFSKNPGQSNYAAGCTFKDAFAHYLAQQWATTVKVMNWGYWGSAGIVASQAYQTRMTQAGVGSIEPHEGMEALTLLLNGPLDQIAVMKTLDAAPTDGSAAEVENNAGGPQVAAESPRPALALRPAFATRQHAGNLLERVTAALLAFLSKALDMATTSIDVDEPFSDFGLDSILGVSFVKNINDVLGVSLNTAIIFDYTSVARLAAHLVETHADRLRLESPAPVAAAVPGGIGLKPDLQGDEEPLENCTVGRASARQSNSLPKGAAPATAAIAVIGMSGQFPDANNVETLWHNLIQGKNSIHELPPHYLDQSKYFSPERRPGKTSCKWGGILQERACFDPLFFNISPWEAESMSPHQRLILQEGWKSLEDAGYNPRSLTNTRVSIFVGAEPTGFVHQTFTGSSDAIVASRLSYHLNLRGPAMVVNTGCSSSGVAIHLACESLRRGESSLALAGGVFAAISEGMLIGLAQTDMLSPSGTCHTFDHAADGTVFSEGVGMVVLKRLEDAMAAGDPIYGVIAASGIKQDGASNGITAPNGLAQEQLIIDVYSSFGIDPEQISYVETHGTGTRLGDPVEANALRRAFRHFTDKRHFCAVGSIKANIGHTGASAGVIGLMKLLLCFQHRQLPGLLHFETLNPLIEFADSAFYVNTAPTPWPGPDGKLRLAALNSFGHSGTNAHLVVQEFVAAPHQPSLDAPTLVPLSARTEEALMVYAVRLQTCLETHGDGAGLALADVAYTLQVGREAMPERLVFLVHDIPELVAHLAAFRRGEQGGQNSGWRGTVTPESQPPWRANEDAHELMAMWLAQGKLSRVAEWWCQGFNNVDWSLLSDPGGRRRIHLPVYPFATEVYWPERTNRMLAAEVGAPRRVLHPLLHENTSDLEEQRFTSCFHGDEFFLADHRVRGRRTLPAVAYLEMACAALYRATGVRTDNESQGQALLLKDMAWIRPITVDETNLEVHIRLLPQHHEQIRFEIYSNTDSAGEVPVIHAQGTALRLTPQPPPDLDLARLRAACNRASLDAAQCYQTFHHMGLDYGPAFQAIVAVLVGEAHVLAQLRLPAGVPPPAADGLVLHPSLLDAALQATLGLSFLSDPALAESSDSTPKTAMPFALGELAVFGPCTPTMWALIRYAAGSRADDQVQKIDLDLCDEHGKILLHMREFSVRTLPGEAAATSIPGANVLLAPVWNPMVPASGTLWPAAAARVLLIGGSDVQQQAIREFYPELCHLTLPPESSAIAAQLKSLRQVDHIIWIAPGQPLSSPLHEHLLEVQETAVLQLFRLLKALLAHDYAARPLGWTVITTGAMAVHAQEAAGTVHASIHGLVGSMAKEYPHWPIRLLDLEATGTWPWSELFTLPPEQGGDARVYRHGEWFRQDLIPVQQWPLPAPPPYRLGGVYVVIGGAGGIGQAWSRFMVQQYGAHLVWIGRRAEDASLRADLEPLAELGPRPLYIQADARDGAALRRAFAHVKSTYGHIHGVVHSALVLLDQTLANMDEDRFRAGLSAKADVSVRLAQVCANEPLDFLLFFAAMQTFVKAPGQSNYAAGCTFQDAFAQQLRQLSYPVKIINWGYWGSIGIVKDDFYRQRMAAVGIDSIEIEDGLAALHTLLSGPLDQVALVKTLRPEAVQAMAFVDMRECITIAPPAAAVDLEALQARLPEQYAQLERLKTDGVPHSAGMEELLLPLLWGSLQSLGLFRTPQVMATGPGAWPLAPGLLPTYARWFAETFRLLGLAGYLHDDRQSLTGRDCTDVDLKALWHAWDERKQTWLAEPNQKAAVILVERSLRALPDILTGKSKATDIMFPDGSMELVEGIYKGNVVADYFNEVLGDTVVAYIRQRLERQTTPEPVRILEIGAGTGGTTAVLLPKLKPYSAHIREYCYSDISRAFLLHAQRQYAPEHPFLTMQLFDVERPLAAQNIETASYDLVIAANVLHATKNIRQTLANVKATLRRGGLLLLNELHSNALFVHLTFGLLAGWWRYEDDVLRLPGCPGLAPETWARVLQEAGFPRLLFPAAASHALGQHIIVAQSDGIIRQAPDRHVTPARTAPPGAAAALQQVAPTEVMPVPTPVPAGVGDHSDETLRRKSVVLLKQLVADTLKMSPRQIASSASLQEYGIDSILVIQLSNAFREVFDQVSTTLFFEIRTIDALVDHFMATQRATLRRLTGLDAAPTETTTTAPAPTPPPRGFRSTHRFAHSSLAAPDDNLSSLAPASGRGLFTVQDIAIIGLSGRYPGARNVHEFWQRLKTGTNCISEIPRQRWDWRQFHDEEKGKPGSSYSRWGGFLDDVDKFDPLFFQISPREAESMDPQERLFLETVYASIEDAGYTPATLCPSRQVGVFAGVMNGTYSRQPSHWSIANRISYVLDFHGPSLAVNTACSSSLSAIHLALESLYLGTSDCAIAGGVNLILNPIHYLTLTSMSVLSASDTCRVFGAGADGFVDGEGVGAVVLKPLAQAIADGDHIYGVLKGSMVNAGGKTNGYTVPNPQAQAEVITAAWRRAGVHAATLSYIEAHGTGTTLGDPIEIAGLTRAFEQDTQHKQFCAIGSVKSNIGHSESAAGIAGLTKVLLQMQHGELVPSLHAEVSNPHIDFSHTPFVLQRQLAAWQRPVLALDAEGEREFPRIAGLSSFGAGGANAHLVVEEYRAPAAVATAPAPYVIVLSARTADGLKQVAANLHRAVDDGIVTDDLAAIAYTLQVGREAMAERLAFMAASLDELQTGLHAFRRDAELPGRTLYRDQVKRHRETITLFAADDDMAAAIDAWIAKGKYDKLLELWVKGFHVDWHKLYETPGLQHGSPRRTSLPTYPFARERYWLEDLDLAAAAASPDTLQPALASPDARPDAATNNAAETLMLVPVWTAVPSEERSDEPSPHDGVLIVGGTAQQRAVLRHIYPEAPGLDLHAGDDIAAIAARLAELEPLRHLVVLAPASTVVSATDESLIHEQDRGVLLIFRLIKALLTCEYGGRDLDWTLVTTLTQAVHDRDPIDPTHAAVHGLAGSLAKEYPHWRIRLIDLEQTTDWGQPGNPSALVQQMLCLPPDSAGNAWAYRSGEWFRQELIPVHDGAPAGQIYRHHGVYVVIGGAGGLGALWSQFMIEQYGAHIIWIGRRPKDTTIQAKLDALARYGPPPLYLVADASDRQALERAYAEIKRHYPHIHGVIHAAIVLLDKSLAGMDEARFRAGLAAKIDVCVRLAQVFATENLDFTLFFSSLQSFSKSPGQSNYAAGCTFKDAFARALARQWPGRIKVMNWGYWGHTGIVAAPDYQERMQQAGIGSLDPAEGLAALEVLLNGPLDQVALLKVMTQAVAGH